MLATFPSEPITSFRSTDKHFRVKWRLKQEWKERELAKEKINMFHLKQLIQEGY